MSNVTIYALNGQPIVHHVTDGTSLLQAIGMERLDTPCGGNGRCGKCRVRVDGQVSAPTQQEQDLLGADVLQGGTRLACLATVEGDCTVYLSANNAVQAIREDGLMPEFKLHPIFDHVGAAVDIGTTTLAAKLYVPDGTLLAQASAPNPQRSYGADVISRIEKSLAGERAVLAQCIRDGINELLVRMCAAGGVSGESIDVVLLTGNTTMLYLLKARDVDCLSHAPFEADELFGRWTEPKELTLTAAPQARIYLPRCMSAFVGADITCSLLASQIYTRQSSALLADIGTNGELVLWHKGKLLCCSTAAGPVFEGAAISQGMQAGSGAIDHVTWRNGAVHCHTLGDAPAVGICGSGIVDAVAVFCRQEIIDETGAFSDGAESCRLADHVSLTQKDIRMVQLAKSAICAGMLTLMEVGNIRAEALSQLVIAGGFGSFLDLHSAACMGLYPAELEQCAAAIGNASLTGASMMLLRREFLTESAALAEKSETVDLSSNPIFMDNYVEQMSF